MRLIMWRLRNCLKQQVPSAQNWVPGHKAVPDLRQLSKNVNARRHKNYNSARRWWITPVILATWEAKIKRIKVQG
jgi:hypothetical protein